MGSGGGDALAMIGPLFASTSLDAEFTHAFGSFAVCLLQAAISRNQTTFPCFLRALSSAVSVDARQFQSVPAARDVRPLVSVKHAFRLHHE